MAVKDLRSGDQTRVPRAAVAAAHPCRRCRPDGFVPQLLNSSVRSVASFVRSLLTSCLPCPPSATLYRTHTCGALRSSDVGTDVVLLGWVHRIRDMGSVIFLDVRDRYGVTQVVTDAEPLLSQAKKLKTEMVVAVLGTVAPRSAETVNAEARDRRRRGRACANCDC